MNVPNETIEAVKAAFPVFWDNWLPEKMKQKGFMSRPTGKGLIELWYEFVFSNMQEVEGADE